ncbi:MAG: hypothetical protein GY733_02695, partial [bacterium]|nr:hypothetical protein [bacterium]
MAETLLDGLRAVRAAQRRSLAAEGLRVDEDTWLWPGGPPNCEAALTREAERVAGGSATALAAHMRVVEKLLDRVGEDGSPGPFLHLAAVQEALGCLIPESLHDKLDGQAARRAKGVGERGSVNVFAGKFSLSVFREQALRENRMVPKDVLEFFLIVARHVSRVLELPLAVASHKLGHMVGTEQNLAQLLAGVEGWQQWSVRDVRGAVEWYVPVCVDVSGQTADWVFVRVVSATEGEALGGAQALVVQVTDRARRQRLARRVACAVVSLLRGAPVQSLDAVGARVEVVEGPPTERRESIVAVLGLIFWRVAAHAKVQQRLAMDSARFVADVRAAADRAFGFLREQASVAGVTDVLACLADAGKCRDLLDVLGSAVVSADGDARATVPKILRAARGAQKAGSFEPLKFLTWNVSAALAPAKAARAPVTWTALDNLLAVQAWIRRWQPDVLALQECPARDALSELEAEYVLLGVAEAHAGYVHLYARRGMSLAVKELAVNAPCVIATGVVDGEECDVAACHLAPERGERAEAERRRQLAVIVKSLQAQAKVVMGDLNVSDGEARDLCEEHGLRDADYASMSWNPAASQYYGPDHGYAGPGYRFDRVLC